MTKKTENQQTNFQPLVSITIDTQKIKEAVLKEIREVVLKEGITIPCGDTARTIAYTSVALAIVKRLKWQPEIGKKATTIQSGFICEGIPELKEKGLAIQVRTSANQFLLKLPAINKKVLAKLGMEKLGFMYSNDMSVNIPDSFHTGTPKETFDTFVNVMTKQLEHEIESAKLELQEATDEECRTAAAKIVNEIIDCGNGNINMKKGAVSTKFNVASKTRN